MEEKLKETKAAAPADSEQNAASTATNYWKNIEIDVLWQVSVGGALGGLLYWITGGKSGGTSDIVSFFISTFGGACAGGIGVFVLANSETTNRLRLMFFAMICGLSYPVVLEAAKKLAPTKTEQQIEQTADKVKAEPIEASGEVAATMKENPAISTDPEDGRELASITSNAIKQISDEIGKSPEPDAVEALQEIGTAAAKSGYVVQAQEAIAELNKLETPAAVSARESIKNVLTTGDDAAVSTPATVEMVTPKDK